MAETLITEAQLNAKISEITEQLNRCGIPLDQWGKGKAKTIGHLAKEIIEGETVLVNKGGEIVRRVELVHVDVRHTNGDIELQLVEDRQVFKDGRERRRGLTGVSEKIKLGEDPRAVVVRALAEELDVQNGSEIDSIGTEEESKVSSSYPGLATKYLRHEMQANLPASAFNPDGYIEHQTDKSTYFVWRELE